MFCVCHTLLEISVHCQLAHCFVPIMRENIMLETQGRGDCSSQVQGSEIERERCGAPIFPSMAYTQWLNLLFLGLTIPWQDQSMTTILLTHGPLEGIYTNYIRHQKAILNQPLDAVWLWNLCLCTILNMLFIELGIFL